MIHAGMRRGSFVGAGAAFSRGNLRFPDGWGMIDTSFLELASWRESLS
jgi:hypothetical protein